MMVRSQACVDLRRLRYVIFAGVFISDLLAIGVAAAEKDLQQLSQETLDLLSGSSVVTEDQLRALQELAKDDPKLRKSLEKIKEQVKPYQDNGKDQDFEELEVLASGGLLDKNSLEVAKALAKTNPKARAQLEQMKASLSLAAGGDKEHLKRYMDSISAQDKSKMLDSHGEMSRYVKAEGMHDPQEEFNVYRQKAIEDGAAIRCDVCSVIIRGFLESVKPPTEDNFAEALEGHTSLPPTGNADVDRVRKNKKGCNKHIKDELIAKGWVVNQCAGQRDGYATGVPCLQQVDEPDEETMDHYSPWKEALYYACEQSIGRYSEELAPYLEGVLRRKKSKNLAAVAMKACKKVARCEKSKKKNKKKQDEEDAKEAEEALDGDGAASTELNDEGSHPEL